MSIQFEEIMNDDLNTPKVLELVESLLEEGKKDEARFILQVIGFTI